MTPSVQKDWKHCLPKSSCGGNIYNASFRTLNEISEMASITEDGSEIQLEAGEELAREKPTMNVSNETIDDLEKNYGIETDKDDDKEDAELEAPPVNHLAQSDNLSNIEQMGENTDLRSLIVGDIRSLLDNYLVAAIDMSQKEFKSKAENI